MTLSPLVPTHLNRTPFLDRYSGGEDDLQDVRGVLGGQDRGFRALQDRDEVLRPGLKIILAAGVSIEEGCAVDVSRESEVGSR